MSCRTIQDQLNAYLDPSDESVPRQAIAQHLQGCGNCRNHLEELETVVALLNARKAPEPPADLMQKIHLKLAQEPAPQPSSWEKVRGLFNWPSLATGAALAVVALMVMRVNTPLPSIQTAAVSAQQPVAVNIGFDVDRDVSGVTYEIELPEGLQFVDADGQPLAAHNITWQGSLKRGKTVVPIVVQGTQPGRYEILATVRKNQLVRQTRIILPVEVRRDSERPQVVAELPAVVRGVT